jgi:transposase
MIQTTATMRILAAVEPVDFRRGIDGLAAICRQQLERDPMNGWAFVFRNRRGTAIKILLYDGQGFWLCHKRLSSGKFCWWPTAPPGADQASPTIAVQRCPARTLAAHQLHVLLSAGNPEAVQAVPVWRPVSPRD